MRNCVTCSSFFFGLLSHSLGCTYISLQATWKEIDFLLLNNFSLLYRQPFPRIFFSSSAQVMKSIFYSLQKTSGRNLTADYPLKWNGKKKSFASLYNIRGISSWSNSCKEQINLPLDWYVHSMSQRKIEIDINFVVFRTRNRESSSPIHYS